MARGARLAGVYAALPRPRGSRADETAASPCRVEVSGETSKGRLRTAGGNLNRRAGAGRGSARPRRGRCDGEEFISDLDPDLHSVSHKSPS